MRDIKFIDTRIRRLTPMILAVLLVSACVVGAAMVWTRTLGGGLNVLVVEYGAEIYVDEACKTVATVVPIAPMHQGEVGKSQVLYLKNVGGGRMFIYWTIVWESPNTVPTSAEFSWDGSTYQNWNAGVLNFVDMQSGDMIRVRWRFTVPPGANLGADYRYIITLKGESGVPSG